MVPTKKKIVYIYKLIDPRDSQVKYIGATVDPKRRQYQHGRGQFVSKDMRQWSSELRKVNLCPNLVIIEECPIENSSTQEKYWIDYYLDKNAPLLNYDGVQRKYSHDKPGNSIRTK